MIRNLRKLQNILLYSWLILSLLFLIGTSSKYAANSQKVLSLHEKRFLESIAIAEPVNINLADKLELMKIKGIGTKRAQAIISYRKKHGKFKHISELKFVPGITKQIIESNKEVMVLK